MNNWHINLAPLKSTTAFQTEHWSPRSSAGTTLRELLRREPRPNCSCDNAPDWCPSVNPIPLSSRQVTRAIRTFIYVTKAAEQWLQQRQCGWKTRCKEQRDSDLCNIHMSTLCRGTKVSMLKNFFKLQKHFKSYFRAGSVHYCLWSSFQG